MAILADEDGLQVTVRRAVYGGAIAGITTTVGGLLVGPVGLLAGGVVGGALAYVGSRDFRSVSQVIRDMNDHDKQLLYNSVKEIVENSGIDDYPALIAFLRESSGLPTRQQLMDELVSFLRDNMRLRVPLVESTDWKTNTYSVK